MPDWLVTGPFRRAAGGIEARLAPVEIELLRQLCSDLAQRLHEVDDHAASSGPLARLFPDGYRDSPERADELRSLIQDDLRDGKIAAARSVVETLSDLPPSRRVTLSEDDVEHWLTTLNDLRLYLGTQLGVTEDQDGDDDEQDGDSDEQDGDSDEQDGDDDERDGDSDEMAKAARDVYHVLSWLQSALVDVLVV